jgi:FkbM family methyltransferase
MTFRKAFKKWLYGRCPGFAGKYPYFGTYIHFPAKSVVFNLVCEQGVYESENLNMLQQLARPGTWFFDIGTNVGLMSAPILQLMPTCHVLSFEPSPNTLPFLRRTVAGSPHSARWNIVPKAVGSAEGRVRFNVSSQENGAFDGLQNTRRVPQFAEIELEMTTIDVEWKRLGSPAVSVIKIDVEGAELAVLRGARECLGSQKPPVLVEWNAENLAAYDCPYESLLDFASSIGFKVIALPSLIEVTAASTLQLHMLRTESFLLLPAHLGCFELDKKGVVPC